MKYLLIATLIVYCAFSCKKEKNDLQLNETTVLTDEVYDIYGLILYQLSSINIVVSVTDTSFNCSDYLNITERDMEVSASIIENCKTINYKGYEIDSLKLLSGGIIIVSQPELEIFSHFESLSEHYGATGLFRFGYPVFYNEGKNAIFEMNHICGSLCGNGSIVIVEKIKGVWQIKNTYLTWIS